ncbi:hypothetical protein GCM10023192_15920 [Amycolatopsis samaneae]
MADPPDDVKATPRSDELGIRCSWVQWGAPLISVVVPSRTLTNLDELAKYHEKRAGNLEPWAETSMYGLPVVIYREVPGPANCDVAVGITDTTMIHVGLVGNQTHSQYWENDPCGNALKTTEFVINALRNH